MADKKFSEFTSQAMTSTSELVGLDGTANTIYNVTQLQNGILTNADISLLNNNSNFLTVVDLSSDIVANSILDIANGGTNANAAQAGINNLTQSSNFTGNKVLTRLTNGDVQLQDIDLSGAFTSLSSTLPITKGGTGSAAAGVANVGGLLDEANQVIGNELVIGDDGAGNSILDVANRKYSFNKQVCMPGTTQSNWPGSWYKQTTSLTSWTETICATTWKKEEFNNLKNISISFFMSADTDNGNDVNWKLYLANPSNVSERWAMISSTDSGATAATNVMGVFGMAYTEFTKTLTSGSGVFDNFWDNASIGSGSLTEAKFVLEVSNNGTQGSVVTNCFINGYYY